MLPVVQNNVVGFNAKFEGRIHHMYLDVKGFVTIGVGNLLATAIDAAKLAFTHGLTGPLATAAESRNPAGRMFRRGGGGR